MHVHFTLSNVMSLPLSKRTPVSAVSAPRGFSIANSTFEKRQLDTLSCGRNLKMGAICETKRQFENETFFMCATRSPAATEMTIGAQWLVSWTLSKRKFSTANGTVGKSGTGMPFPRGGGSRVYSGSNIFGTEKRMPRRVYGQTMLEKRQSFTGASPVQPMRIAPWLERTEQLAMVTRSQGRGARICSWWERMMIASSCVSRMQSLTVTSRQPPK